MAFGRVNDLQLLEPYLNKYMDSALEIWNTRSYQIASYLLNNLYPIQLGSKALADATKDLIAKPEIVAIPALRRILVESLAGLERGLKAQEVDN